MGRLPPERLEVVSPFEATALDLFGPFWVKDTAKGRRKFKCWVVAYICMGAKAVCMLPVPGYGTDEFLTTHRFFTGLYGKPRIVYSDHAPSLVKAAETPDWAEIGEKVGAQGTEWRLTAKGLLLAERVGGAGDPFRQAHPGPRTSARRNVGLPSVWVSPHRGSGNPEQPAAIPPSDHRGRVPRPSRPEMSSSAGPVEALDTTERALEFTLDQDQDVALRGMCDQQAKIVRAWRAKWLDTVFPDLVSRPKWKSAHRNLRCGDLGHVKYSKTIGHHEWRLALVEEVHPDEDGTVRTVTVGFRPRNKRDTGKAIHHQGCTEDEDRCAAVSPCC